MAEDEVAVEDRGDFEVVVERLLRSEDLVMVRSLLMGSYRN